MRKGDVSIAKNYLEEKELSELNRIVTMYLDYAEDQANRHRTMNMKQWADKLDVFLQFNERDLLTHAGKVEAEVAKRLAESRYEEFTANRLKDEARQTDAEDLKEIETLARELDKKADLGNSDE